MTHVRSNDGTAIAFDRAGDGPVVIVVDGALCSRGFGPSPKLAAQLARHCTVITYDRRGRGESGNTQPYSPAREVEDLAAIIEAAGGSATLLGLSSGAALALHAAASGAPVDKVIAYEPPYVDEGGRGDLDHEAHLQRLLAQGSRGGAVKYFMKDMVGAPAPLVLMLRMMPWVWPRLVAVAHTLPYDAAVMTRFQIPRTRFAAITRPTLVMNGGKTDPRLRAAAQALAGIIPSVEYRELSGQTHNVRPKVLTPLVVDFLGAAGSRP